MPQDGVGCEAFGRSVLGMRTTTLFTLLLAALPVLAQTPNEVSWNGLCEAVKGRELVVRTNSGATTSGYCLHTTDTTVQLGRRNRPAWSIARSEVESVRVRRSRIDRFRAFHTHRTEAFAYELILLDSPFFPLDAVLMPATMIYGAVGLPVCAVVDLFGYWNGTRAIRISG